MVSAYDMEDDLMRSIDRLDEAMVMLIDIYDRLDTYSDHANFAAYIADLNSINSQGIQVKDRELNASITDLQQIIISNVVLDRYGLLMHAFEQRYFPRAERCIL